MQEQEQKEFDNQKLKLLQQRLIIQTTNLELQKEMLNSEADSFKTQNQLEMDQLTKIQELYRKALEQAANEKQKLKSELQ